jgi:hypothetical protein
VPGQSYAKRVNPIHALGHNHASVSGMKRHQSGCNF